jgi:hypothetical protein
MVYMEAMLDKAEAFLRDHYSALGFAGIAIFAGCVIVKGIIITAGRSSLFFSG